MSKIHSDRKLTSQLNSAVAKVAVTAILPILRMCSQSLRGTDSANEDQAIGFMTGLAFHQREDANLNTLEVLKGVGQAYGEQLRGLGENALSAAVAGEYFIEGLKQGFGQKLPISLERADA